MDGSKVLLLLISSICGLPKLTSLNLAFTEVLNMKNEIQDNNSASVLLIISHTQQRLFLKESGLFSRDINLESIMSDLQGSDQFCWQTLKSAPTLRSDLHHWLSDIIRHLWR